MSDDPRRTRLAIFGFVALSLFGALFARLWYLQVLESEELQTQAQVQAIEVVYEQAPRGRILDRNGTVLVDNKVVQVVAIDPRALNDALDDDEQDEMFLDLAVAISRSGRLTKVETIRDEVNDERYGPFDVVPVAVDVDPDLLVYFGERADRFPGVEVQQRTVRSYPYGRLAAHVLGYVGPLTQGEWEEVNAGVDPSEPDAELYQLSDEIGKTGIERIFEADLRGTPGERRFVVDEQSRVIDELSGRAPVPGNDVWLTIDADLQALTEQELEDGLRAVRGDVTDDTGTRAVAAAGSAVAIDPRNGDVLAMASFPDYEPSQFVNGISQREFDQLRSEENFAPILNRAIQGEYAPGSTFKVVTAHAAIAEGVVGPDGLWGINENVLDTGTYVYPDCLNESESCIFTSPSDGGFVVDLAQSLTVSSDVYYYRIGGEGFWRRPQPEDEGIQAWSREYGLGQETAVQLPYERSGTVPDRAWLDAGYEEGRFIRQGSDWRAGDTINLSIGQGDLTVTPIQLTNVYATLANGGRVHQPNVAHQITDRDGTVVREFGARVVDDLEIPNRILRPITDGLLGVPRYGGVVGTAAEVFNDASVGADFPLDNWPVAGKTGTAQVDGKADTSLFVGYGPVDYPALGIDVEGEPEIAIGVVLEESGFGSAAAAPVTARILDPYARGEVPTARPVTDIDAVTDDGDDADPDDTDPDGVDDEVAQ